MKLFIFKQICTISNLLTLSRLFLTPFLMRAIKNQDWVTAFIVFFVAAITDMFDGIFARWHNEETLLGACLDPLADKILILGALLALSHVNPLPYFWWFILFIMMKEIVLLVGIGVLSLLYSSLPIKPTWWGKSAMMAQVLFLFFVLLCNSIHLHSIFLLKACMGLVSFFIFAALLDYMIIGFRFIRYTLR